MRVYKGVGRFGMIAMLMILVFGIYMAVVSWRGAAWTSVALGSVVLIIIIMWQMYPLAQYAMLWQ